MDLSLSEPALIFPAIAILILGYVNRYVATAAVIRSFKKDYDSGYKHTDLANQLKVLKKRIELSRWMLLIAASALLFSCLSMFLIYIGNQDFGKIAFGLGLLSMISSIFISLYETSLSNKSLIIEIDDVLNS